MVDIHAHIIPGVDDGSPDLETSINMIKHEISIGVDAIICTPHHIFHRYEKDVDDIKRQFKILEDEVIKQNLQIKLYLGQEIYYTHREDIISMLKTGKLLTLNNTNFVLLEFSFTNEPEDLIDILYNFSVNGYQVIVAHVERYEWITYKKVISLISEGAKIQVNSNAFLGLTTFREKRFVKKLLRNKLVDYVASDTHSFRASTLDKSYSRIKNPALFNF